MGRSRSRSVSRRGGQTKRRPVPSRLSLSRRPATNKSRDVRRRRSPSRAAYAKSYRDRDKEWQRRLDEKHQELTQIKTNVAALELKIKDQKETIAELLDSNKHQAGMLAAYAENEVQSGKRFERLNDELVKCRITVNDLVTSRAKILKQLQFEDTEWARERHCLQAASSHSQSSPEGPTAKQPQQSEDESSDSSQEEEETAAAARPQQQEQQPQQTPQAAETATVDRGLSAETLPMSPRVPPTDSPTGARAQTEDMPEPSTDQPMSFEPSSSAPEAQGAVSATVQ